MKLKEKFDMLVGMIENNISSDNEKIETELSRCFGENIRLLADAFKFISGMTLSKYIRERKIINVLNAKREFGISFDEAAEQYGFADAASFSKSAKTCFGKAPSQMTDEEIARSPLSLEQILNEQSLEGEQYAVEMPTSFGVSEAQFHEISKTLSIAAVYGLSDENAEFAYSLSRDANISVEAACDFMNDFLLQIENGTYIPGYSTTELARICCLYDQSYSEAQHIMYELDRAGYSSTTQLPSLYFDIYFSKENSRLGLDVETICEMAETMERYGLGINDLFDIVDRGQWKYDGDFFEAIERFEEDTEEWNCMLREDIMSINDDMQEVYFDGLDL